MSHAIDLLLRHRSIRQFTRAPVPDGDVRRAVAAGQAASTSSAVQGYCAIRVRDERRRARLAELTGPQPKVAECGAFFVICGDTRRHRLAVQHAGGVYDARLEAFLLAVVDATLFAQNMVVAFEAMGYGICYIGGLRNDLATVDRILRIPDGVYPLYGLCVGVPAETPDPRPRLPVDAVLCEETYPDDEVVGAHLAEYDARYETYLREREATPRGWSTLMAGKFQTPRRPEIAKYYASKGADLQ